MTDAGCFSYDVNQFGVLFVRSGYPVPQVSPRMSHLLSRCNNNNNMACLAIIIQSFLSWFELQKAVAHKILRSSLVCVIGTKKQAKLGYCCLRSFLCINIGTSHYSVPLLFT